MVLQLQSRMSSNRMRRGIILVINFDEIELKLRCGAFLFGCMYIFCWFVRYRAARSERSLFRGLRLAWKKHDSNAGNNYRTTLMLSSHKHYVFVRRSSRATTLTVFHIRIEITRNDNAFDVQSHPSVTNRTKWIHNWISFSLGWHRK